MAAAMAMEQELSYASVVFRSNKHRPPEAKTEDTVYDEVKVQNETSEQPADTNGSLVDKKANNRRRHFKRLACGLGILSVILLSGIIAVCVYIITLSHENERLKGIEKNHLDVEQNLKNRNNKLSSENENLRRDYNNLTVQMSNLTRKYTVSENKITNLTEEILNLMTQNEERKSQRNSLTEQIQEMVATNVSRAQWTIDAYCPKKKNGRQCKPCQVDWEHTEPSCYSIHNREWKTWEDARENCRGQGADLAVIHSNNEKDAINDHSSGRYEYWIGLRVKDGQWKWIDGRYLTESFWRAAPTEGHCAVSVKNEGWKSVRCDARQRWICKKTALSL